MGSVGNKTTALRIKNIAKRFAVWAVILLPFLLFWIFGKTLGKDIYVFEWMSDNNFWYVWIIVCILLLFRQDIAAVFLSAGSAIGILLGHFLGGFLNELSMKKITSDMPPEEIDRLSQHDGVFIWIVTLFVALIIGIFFQKKQRKPDD